MQTTYLVTAHMSARRERHGRLLMHTNLALQLSIEKGLIE